MNKIEQKNLITMEDWKNKANGLSAILYVGIAGTMDGKTYALLNDHRPNADVIALLKEMIRALNEPLKKGKKVVKKSAR